MQRRDTQGFTLIEMVVTITILGILGAVAAYGITGGVLAHQSNTEALDTLSKVRLATERMAREIRQVRRDPADTARYDISEPFSATRLEFTRADGTDVVFDSGGSTVTIAYDNPAGTFTLTDQLNNIAFTYYDVDGLAAASASAVAAIEIELILTDANGNNLAQQTRIALREQP